MLIDPPNQIIGHVDVKRAADFAGENVDVVVTLFTRTEHSAGAGSPAFAGDDTEYASENEAS